MNPLRRAQLKTTLLILAMIAGITEAASQPWQFALAAKQTIDLKGNNITTDSFDSVDPNYSTDGLYDPAKRKAGGDIAATGGIINVQNAQVMGTLYTGPSGQCSIGAGGSVGDLSWVLGGNLGLQPGHYRNDLNLNLPDVLPPYQVGLIPTGMTIGGTNYAWILGNCNYLYTSPTGARFMTGDTVLVMGRARVYVTGDFIMQGTASIIITPGASLELYVGGTYGYITTIRNAGNCGTFAYYGLPGNTNVAISGIDSFLGCVYAPNARLRLSSGGNNSLDFQGACAADSIEMNGAHFRFHYDEHFSPASVAARLTTQAGPVGNPIQFTVSGALGFPYVVEASTNLLDWEPLVTNTPPFVVQDQNTTNSVQRFYRAVWKP